MSARTPARRGEGGLMAAALHDEIARAADRLRASGLVAFPTETVYGLGADALNPAAVDRVFALKGRPANNPLIVHVADVTTARRLVADWSRDAEQLAKALWPGPLTIVLSKAGIVPANVTAGGGTVALRCPDHPVALGLLRAFGGPMVGPSANPSGFISPTSAEHVRAGFADAIARDELLVLDGGPCRAGIESTVVSLAGTSPCVLRRGVVSAEQIESVLKRRVLVSEGPIVSGAPLPSPGMLERHYAPRTPARLFDAADWPEILDAVVGEAAVVSHQRARVAHRPHGLLRMPMDAEGYAARLYAALHEADEMGATVILVEEPRGEGPLWDAIRDRLRRACI